MKNISPPVPFDSLPSHKIGQIHAYRKQLVFSQGAAPEALFYVVSGMVVLERHTEAGQIVVLHRASAGGLIAEASLFSDMYHCDCVAECDSILLKLDKPAVLAKIEADPKFAASLVAKMARQVQRYRRQLELRTILPAIDRVFAGVSDGWLTGSVMQFAGDIGLSPEATYRCLSKLVANGLLRKTGRGLYATNKEIP